MIAIYGYSELLEEIAALKKIYKEKLRVDVFGVTQKGRKLFSLKTGEEAPQILAIGSVHGREAVSALFLMKSLRLLLGSGKNYSIMVCPMVNPDSVEIFWGRDEPFEKTRDFKAEFFKNNANNINLNANFPFEFSLVPITRQGGREAASENETKAIVALCEKMNFKGAISLHARGNCVFWRDEGNGEIEGDREFAEGIRNSCGFGLIEPTRSPEDYSGGFENWFRHRFQRPAFCVELVKDNEISYRDMCRCFEEAVLWKNTKNLLKVFCEHRKFKD